MAPTSSTEPSNSGLELSPAHKAVLKHLAWASVGYGQRHGRPLPLHPDDYDPPLRTPRDSFITLNKHGRLRGCIGSIEAGRPLVADVVQNAFAAAFKDPRFPPLEPGEMFELELRISVLSHPEPMQFESEKDLLQQLRPGVDGLILNDGPRRGTFLPSVWENLPEPRAFLEQLKLKAGLPKDYWSKTVRVERYTAESW